MIQLYKKINLSKKEKQEIYDTYWNSNITCEEIIKKYNLPIKRGNELCFFVFSNCFFQNETLVRSKNQGYKICRFCGCELIQKSRSNNYWDHCKCDFRGTCQKCGDNITQEIGFCKDCEAKNYNIAQEAIEKNSDLSPNLQEEEFLSVFQYHREKIFPNNSIDFSQIGFLIKRSPRYCEEIFCQVLNKGYLKKRKYFDEKTGKIQGGISRVFPKVRNLIGEEKRVKKIIQSAPAKLVFEKLLKKYPYVFPEQVAVTFLNFDLVKNEIDEQYQHWCFTKRFDFLCCTNNFIPILAVEYNGSHHWRDPATDYEVRKFKRKICELVGITYLDINSWRQIESKL